MQKTPAGKKKKQGNNPIGKKIVEKKKSSELSSRFAQSLSFHQSLTRLKPNQAASSPLGIDIRGPGLLQKRMTRMDSLSSSNKDEQEDYDKETEGEQLTLLERRKRELLQEKPKNPVKKGTITRSPMSMERRSTIK